jgi:hypothetical protein
MQDVTELSWLIDSSPSWNNFTDTKRVHALLNLRKKEKKKKSYDIEFDINKIWIPQLNKDIFIICLTSAR